MRSPSSRYQGRAETLALLSLHILRIPDDLADVSVTSSSSQNRLWQRENERPRHAHLLLLPFYHIQLDFLFFFSRFASLRIEITSFLLSEDICIGPPLSSSASSPSAPTSLSAYVTDLLSQRRQKLASRNLGFQWLSKLLQIPSAPSLSGSSENQWITSSLFFSSLLVPSQFNGLRIADTIVR